MKKQSITIQKKALEKGLIGVIILSLLLLLFNCDSSRFTEKSKIEKYRKLIEATDDSILVAAQDTSSFNAILAKLTKQYNLNKDKIIFKRNPFSTIETVKSKQSVKTSSTNNSTKKTKVVNKPLYELTGIISIGETKKALVNGDLYEVGDVINNAEIIKIENKQITLKNSKRTFELNLKKK